MRVKRLAVLLAGLLLVTGLPAASKGVHIGPLKISIDTQSKVMARAVASQVREVQQRFADNRRALSPVKDTNGQTAYLRQDVAGLIARTGGDLDQSIERAQPSKTEPLRAWANEEIGRIQAELPSPGPTASFPGSSAPRAVAVFASLRGFGLPMLASTKRPSPKPAPPKSAPPAPAPPKPQTLPASTADRLLDEVAQVVNQIFVLAKNEDLEVKLWVGSTPSTKATFRFWPQGSIKGSPPSATIIETDGQKSHILRGLYYYSAYSAAWKKGAVTQVLGYPNPDGSPVTTSERLDLVKGSRFFCCQFDKTYCHHVEDEKDCH